MTGKIFFLIFLIFFIRCSTDPVVISPESVSEYYIISKIAPDIDHLGAVVVKTVPENISIDISGAKVVISGNNQSTSLVELKPGFYIGPQDSVSILPDKKYEIMVTLPDGKLVRGKTFVPGDFHIIKNPDDTLVFKVTDTGEPFFRPIVKLPQLSWTKSRHALSYLVKMEGGKAAVDTCVYLPEDGPERYFRRYPEAIEYIEKIAISIVAYDSSYLPYYNLNYPDPYGENSKIHQVALAMGLQSGQNDNLEGSRGYFASSHTITDSVIVRYIKETGN